MADSLNERKIKETAQNTTKSIKTQNTTTEEENTNFIDILKNIIFNLKAENAYYVRYKSKLKV